MNKSRKRMGRPPLEAGKNKDRRLILRLSEEELERFQSLAKKRGLTLSAWIREILGGQK